MRWNKLVLTLCCICAAAGLSANEEPTSNENPTYEPSRVRANLQVEIDNQTRAVHFIRDNNDPKILTKTYVLKHADGYSIRPFLREMVQAQRVNYNTPPGRRAPDFYNVYSKDNAQKTEKIFIQTGVECVQYTDGTNILIISAEDYRFSRSDSCHTSIDDLVLALDQPGIMNSSGQPKFIYFPKYRRAEELCAMIRRVGATVSGDSTELIGGKDKFEYDADLNCIFFNTASYSRKNIEYMLSRYDIPYPEVRITFKVYELDAENDDRIGLDFQSWKNNGGTRLLGTGALNSHNANLSTQPGIVTTQGTLNAHYFNFEPKWNTRFLDFIAARGHAKIVYTGSMNAQNGCESLLERRSGMLFDSVTPLPSVDSGVTQTLETANARFVFRMRATPQIAAQSAVLDLNIETISLLGFESDGAIRSSQFNTEAQVMLANEGTEFYIGGIEKAQEINTVNGVPILKDIPLLGWFFSTESTSRKKTQLVLTARCELVRPETAVPSDVRAKMSRNSNAASNEK